MSGQYGNQVVDRILHVTGGKGGILRNFPGDLFGVYRTHINGAGME